MFLNEIYSTKYPVYIMDAGSEMLAYNQDGKEAFRIPRYGAWMVGAKNKFEVVAGFNDLEYLKKKYRTENVVKLAKD